VVLVKHRTRETGMSVPQQVNSIVGEMDWHLKRNSQLHHPQPADKLILNAVGIARKVRNPELKGQVISALDKMIESDLCIIEHPELKHLAVHEVEAWKGQRDVQDIIPSILD